jgi:UDP-N-acetylglucosamine 2-epimerase (non-hydrolysing)
MESILDLENPDVVIVQGDTATTFVGAVSGYYARKKVAHVEAGLRTGNKYAPFPEEINRRITSTVADYNFAATQTAKSNLLKEGYPEDTIFITGNTVIDALYLALEKIDTKMPPLPELEVVNNFNETVLITGHRRENFGEPFRDVCEAFRILASDNPDVCFIYPVHLNPNVQQPVREILNNLPNFFLLPPLPYLPFVWLMNHARFIITDSGGIQEEAPALGKPVLVTREFTERPEGVAAGTVKLVGTDKEKIIKSARELLTDSAAYERMHRAANPYGDGTAAKQIIDILKTPS